MSSPLSSEVRRFELLAYELSARFISLPSSQIDAAIEAGLQRIVETLGVDRSTLSHVVHETGHFHSTHTFAAEGIPPTPRGTNSRLFPWTLARARAGLPVVFSRLSDLPPEAEQDRQGFERVGLQAHLALPVKVAGQLVCVLGVGSLRRERDWDEELITHLQVVGEVFANALARKRAQEELDFSMGLEQVASKILASLLLAPGAEGAHSLEPGLREIGEFLGIEWVALWEEVPRARFGIAQQWRAATSTASLFERIDEANLPWLHGRMKAGRVVRLARISELPADTVDETALGRAGLHAFFLVPILTDGKVGGALSLGSTHRAHEWSFAMVSGLRLIADVFSTLHVRQASERRRQAAELEAAHWRERLAHLVRVHTAGEMSVALAHEITQPLGAIENYALAARRRLAAEASPKNALVLELLDKMIGQATRAGDVVTRMRGMVQRHELELKPVDLERAVRSCLDMLRMDCDQHEIALELNLEDELPIIVVDEIHLQQVTLNLLRNAMEAIVDSASDERRISVNIARQPQTLCVTISDTGSGIAEGDLERIFESFYSTKAKGLGVGLAICRRLIEAHGGALWASHAPGGGAAFQFTLPIGPAAAKH
jgi:signal transduction histidine kinase